MIRSERASTALLLLVIATTGCASSNGFYLTPSLGAHRPGDKLYEVSGEELERENALALGVAAEAAFLRATALYATGATISESGITGSNKIGDGSLLTLTGDVVVRPFPRLLVQPYGLAGLGFKRHDYSIDDASFDNLLPDDESEFAWHLGVGADLMFGNLGIVAELSDFIGTEGGAFGRHDTFVTAGLRFRMF